MPWFVALALLSIAPVTRRTDDEIARTAAWLRNTYHAELVIAGIDYPLRRPGYVIGGEGPSSLLAAAYLPVLRRELAKYPPGLLKRTRTRRIILARHLSVNGQPRAAVPDFATMDLLLDVELGRKFPSYQARVFHHEFFHLIDVLQVGRWLRDPDWPQLNAPEFRYGPGGVRMQDSYANPFAPTRTIPGFLTPYGTAAVEEDKAEIFSFLMTDGTFLRERAACDAVVRGKLERLKQRLERFCPELNASYHRRLEAHQSAAEALLAARVMLALGGVLPPVLGVPMPGFVYRAPAAVLSPTSAGSPSPASRECLRPSK